MLSGSGGIYLIYAAVGLASILIAEAAYMLFAGEKDRRATLNRRIRLQEKKLTQEEVLIQLRKERGMDGGSWLSVEALRRLRVQSGLTMPMPKFLMITTGTAFALGLAGIWRGMPVGAVLLAVPVMCAVLPLIVLRHLRKRRHKIFGVQLPEALELITRGLKAGHPVPVAVAMVSREMPDPIGSEFGIVADEVTYGSDLVSALHAMYDRVGHEDLPLFVTAVSIQNSSGGNLREILDGLSNTIRERGKLRRKVRSISAEGRMSAYILSAVPMLLVGAIMVLMPNFYADVWNVPLTWYLVAGAAAWLVLGNAIMFKMSNFRL